jgi:hypothetical protein
MKKQPIRRVYCANVTDISSTDNTYSKLDTKWKIKSKEAAFIAHN